MDSHESFQADAADTQHNIFDEIETTIEHDIQAVVGTVTGLFHEIFPGQDGHDATAHLPATPLLEPLFHNPSLDPGQALAPNSLVGDPIADVAYWHHQGSSDTCAIVSQQFVIEQLTGQHVTEDQLVAQAEAHGWYHPGGGTAPNDCGNLLELYGLHVEHYQNATIDDISAQLARGHGVIVGVNIETLLGMPSNPLAPLTAAPTIPGQEADHAVEVIGINRTDPTHPMVILNDPGVQNGAGEMVPLSTFLDAWTTSGNTLVEAW